MSLFWELHQSQRIASAGASAASAESKAARAASKASSIEGKVEKAMMICEALWIIMREKHDLDDKLLEKAVKAVDLQDGKLDGKVVRDVQECKSCHRKVGRNRVKCIYCGAEIGGGVFG